MRSSAGEHLVHTEGVTGSIPVASTIFLDKPILKAPDGTLATAREESQALLTYLFRRLEHPLFQCRFRWTPRSVAFWDNRCAQHHAIWDYWPHRRYGNRVTIKGETPV